MSDKGRVPSGSSRNGLYTFKPYVYRGNGRDTLTPELRRRMPIPRKAAEPTPDGRCLECGYKLSGRNHRTVCG